MSRYDGPVDIGQIAIPVSDVERALAFYRDVLGLRFLFRAPPGLAFLDCGGVRLMLSRPEEGEAPPQVGVIYYRVPDLDAAYTTLKARGATLVDEPHLIARLPDHELWMFFLRDPDNHLLGLMSELRLSPKGAA
jgi:methylmalonyl-CoA/ethylmalonyl-CoA epimerase